MLMRANDFSANAPRLVLAIMTATGVATLPGGSSECGAATPCLVLYAEKAGEVASAAS